MLKHDSSRPIFKFQLGGGLGGLRITKLQSFLLQLCLHTLLYRFFLKLGGHKTQSTYWNFCLLEQNFNIQALYSAKEVFGQAILEKLLFATKMNLAHECHITDGLTLLENFRKILTIWKNSKKNVHGFGTIRRTVILFWGNVTLIEELIREQSFSFTFSWATFAQRILPIVSPGNI